MVPGPTEPLCDAEAIVSLRRVQGLDEGRRKEKATRRAAQLHRLLHFNDIARPRTHLNAAFLQSFATTLDQDHEANRFLGHSIDGRIRLQSCIGWSTETSEPSAGAK